MRKGLVRILGSILAANGVLMLMMPHFWYSTTPGVPGTGPFNPHFVRDIGCAYLASGCALVWFAFDVRARAAALAAAAFLVLHAFVHAWDIAAGRDTLAHIWFELATVFLPAALALWLAWPTSFITERSNVEMVPAAPNSRVRGQL